MDRRPSPGARRSRLAQGQAQELSKTRTTSEVKDKIQSATSTSPPNTIIISFVVSVIKPSHDLFILSRQKHVLFYETNSQKTPK